MRAPSLKTSLLVLAAAAFLPLATDGGLAQQCCNAAGSLTSTAVGPVNGDESFFKLPTGPANVMFLLDDSGSMDNFPQCGDNAWGSGGYCVNPSLAAPTDSTNAAVTFTYTGTCVPWNNTNPSGATSPLYWMSKVTAQTAYADPGRSNALLTDAPPWGNGCTGDHCMFDPNASYGYGDWAAGATSAANYATRRAHDTDPAFAATSTCTALDTWGNPITDYNGRNIVLNTKGGADDCPACMAGRGYYFYRLSRYTRLTGGVPDRWTYNSTRPIFKGTFLNANPPKFMTARKVVKDVAWMDPNVPSKLDKVRLGLAVIDSSGTAPRKARLIVPLGPDRTGSYPPTQASFRQARQYLLSVINYDTSVYTDGATTITDGTTITGGFYNPTGLMTPIGSALLNVGQYFTSTGRYATLLGSWYQTAAFNESVSGDTNAAWARNNANQCSICWACQNNSVVIVTDGSPNSEIGFPTAITSYDNAGYGAAANCGGTTTCGGAVLPRVADWLHAQDLRANAVMSGTQKVTVHTVGINVQGATAVKILQATANLGGGIFQNAEDASALGNAVFNAINQVIPKEDSFSAASAASLQTMQTTAMDAFQTRFKPNQTPTWEGHLYETFLFDEWVAGCRENDPTYLVSCQGTSVPADFNQDTKCVGLYQIDAECDQITQSPTTGEFVKKADPTTPAKIAWDAGQVLSDPTRTGYRSADETASNARTIFTWVNGTKQPFTAANAATLLPYMNISSAWCSSFLTQLGITPAAGQERLTCAQQIIYFVRGWDTLNQDGDGCWGPGNPKNLATCPSGTKGEERNRANDGSSTPFFWKLGDIFHSSPAVEVAPISRPRCDTGNEHQCLLTLYAEKSTTGYANTTELDYYGTTSAYDQYRADQAARKRVVLVGANDGMFHAFHAGDPDGTVDSSGQPNYTNGTGEELWAFVPPDMLPRLKDLTVAHQYMVDASPMLRDVWVDGGPDGTGNKDGIKQRDEYHTMVVFGRRSGGNAWSALDVTNPKDPIVKWTFPDVSCSDDARYVGESWSEFVPQPPPIGAVKMAAANARTFDEQWIVMINGGYDPTMNLGRAVFMLDVWTGKTLWRYTDADFKATLGFGSGTSMFPIPGAVSMVAIGDHEHEQNNDAFFDTATWADLGGNLFVMRMWEPGKIDATTGRVGNWPVARAFEQRRQADDLQRVAGRSEFFFIPVQTYEDSVGMLWTTLGSGNRERIMAQSATCGTDNLIGCCQAGCTNVTSTSTQKYGTCTQTGTFACVNGAYTFGGSSTCTDPVTCGAPSTGYNALHDIHWECPGAPTTSDAIGSASWDGSGLVTLTPIAEREVKGTFNPQTRSRFYGINTFGGRKRFGPTSTGSAGTAKAFDDARTTDIAFGGTCADFSTCTLADLTSGGSALVTGPGWFYEYPATIKTGAPAVIYQNCLMYSTFQPVGASTGTDPCSGNLGVPTAYDFFYNFGSGVPDPSVCGSTVSGLPRAVTSPPSGALLRQDVITGGRDRKNGGPTPTPTPGSGAGSGCLGGGIRGTVQMLDAGSDARQSTIGIQSCAVEMLYSLELTRDEHVCRHATGATCK